MDFKNIRTREDIFKYSITGSMILSIKDEITDEDRYLIERNMGSVWLPYTYGNDSVTRSVLQMPFYSFLLSYGDQGDIQGVKKYCSHRIDILNRDYNVYVGKLFISRYGKEDPISKIISRFIYDNTYYKIDAEGIIHYNTTRGERYRIKPGINDNIDLLSHYNPRRVIECANGDRILKTGFCYFYNCVPLACYEEYDDTITIMDIDGQYHELLIDNGIVVEGYENLSNEFRIQNDSIIDVYDIYRLLKLGIKANVLIRDYGFNYKVVGFLDTISTINVWQSNTCIVYKNSYINREIGIENGTIIIEEEDGTYCVDYMGKTIAYIYGGYINFDPIEYNTIMDLDGYAILVDSDDNISVKGQTLAF